MRLNRVLAAAVVLVVAFAAPPLLWGVTSSSFSSTAFIGTSQFSAAGSFSTGSLYRWGMDTTPAPSPVPEPTGSAWSQVPVGREMTCGLKTDNSLWCWGSNSYGVFATGALDDDIRPATRIGVASWKTIAVGMKYICGIDTSGELVLGSQRERPARRRRHHRPPDTGPGRCGHRLGGN